MMNFKLQYKFFRIMNAEVSKYEQSGGAKQPLVIVIYLSYEKNGQSR